MKIVFPLIFCVLLFGCRFAEPDSEPSVEFTRIPMAEIGGTMRLEQIEGFVRNARPEYKIVLYTKSGEWYVQPFADKPFTEIQPDSKWSNITHLGTEYAALLVAPDFMPEAKIHDLPEKNGSVIVVATVSGTPMYWQTWWFRGFWILVFIIILVAFYRLRLRQIAGEMNARFEERLAERSRIAQELHDSLLQGFVGISMQLDVAADHLPADSPVKKQLNLITGKIGQVIEEGRNTVQGLRASGAESAVNLERRFSQINQDLNGEGKIDFRFIEKGSPRKVCPAIADEIYYIGREALINAFHHSGASRIEIISEYGAKIFVVAVRDNGRGIDSEISETGRARHWGIQGMRERAAKIGANLKISSRAGKGAEIELSIPNHVVFESSVKKRAFGWLSNLASRKSSSGNTEREK